MTISMIVRVVVGGLALAMASAGVAGAATIEVDTVTDGFVDDDECGLREAIQAANGNAAAFGCSKGQGAQLDTVLLRAREYQLGPTTTNENANLNGDLDVTGGGALRVQGKGRDDTEVVQNAADRVFEVATTSGDLTLQELEVRGGDVTDFSAGAARGGNVLNFGGELTLRRFASDGGDAFVGGAVYASGSASLVVDRGTFDAGDAEAGGAVATANTATATIRRSRFLGNDVISSDGSGEGGSIYHASALQMKVLDTQIQGSEVRTSGAANAALGGAIYSSGPLLLRRSLVSGNLVSSATDNAAEYGGGLYNAGGNPRLVNTTMFDNHAGDVGDNDGDGGAIFANAGDVTVAHVTLAANVATDAGDALASGGGTISFAGSILEGPDPCDGSLGFGSAGGNVSEAFAADCGLSDDDLDQANLALGTLGSNGGPTDTIPIRKASDARDFVGKNACKTAAGNEDQRGFRRPAGRRCDAGAFERGAQP